MKRLQQAAVLAQLADRLADQKSWCGETHMQKAVYVLQELTRWRLDYDFILYKHGPFSFELRDDLTGFRADGLFELVPRAPYGPTLVTTPASKNLRQNFKITLARYERSIDFIAKAIGDKGVLDLEKVATALYVTQEEQASASAADRAARLCELKPHVTAQEAAEAIQTIDALRTEAAREFKVPVHA